MVAEVLVADDLTAVDENDEAVIVVAAGIAGGKVTNVGTSGGHTRSQRKINTHNVRFCIGLFSLVHDQSSFLGILVYQRRLRVTKAQATSISRVPRALTEAVELQPLEVLSASAGSEVASSLSAGAVVSLAF
jgi:hypothetical protein